MQSTQPAADEAFLLAVLNSTPVVDGVQRDELATAHAGRSWLREHGRVGSTAEWQAILTARSVLQPVVRGDRPAEDLAPLLEDVRYRPSVSEDGVDWRLETPAGHSAAVRAVLTWDALRRTRPGRLRACANPECALFLIDHSKPNQARWCSMAACGNRMKARRHYERSRTNTN